MRRFFWLKRKLKPCNTGVLVLGKNGKPLVEVNKIPTDEEPYEATEETIRSIEIYLAVERGMK